MQYGPKAGVHQQQSSAFAAFCLETCPRKAMAWALLWSSLPVSSKLLVAFVVGQAALWLGYTAGNGARIATACTYGTAGVLCTAEQWQAMASTLAAQLCLAYLTLDAIHEENAFQLLASTVFTVLTGLLWVTFVAVLEPMMLGWRPALICSFIAATAVNGWLAYVTYQQFGWRVHSRLACDYRRKHAVEKQQLYFLVSRFKTLLRFSGHATFVNVVNCCVLALTSHSSAAAPMREHVVTVPIVLANPARLLLQYSSVAAPLVDAANQTVDLQQNATSAFDSMHVAIAAAAAAGRAAAGGANGMGTQLSKQAAAASMQSSSSNASAVTGLLVSLAIWLLPAAWLLVTYMAVARNSNRLQQLSSMALPVLLMLPALPLYWMFSPAYFWPERLVVRVLLLACPMAIWLGLAVVVWLAMTNLMKQFRLPAIQELLADAVDDSSDHDAYQQVVPEQLQPLLQGAWLLKPSYSLHEASSSNSSRLMPDIAGLSLSTSGSFGAPQAAATALPGGALPGGSSSCSWPGQLGTRLWRFWHCIVAIAMCSSKRWRFFQLSSDLTTLRWAWNKYILLYYVDSITANPDRLTLTLHMVLDPDLTLAFNDPKTYDHWESALQLLLHMLTGAAPGSGLHTAKGAYHAGFSIQSQNPAVASRSAEADLDNNQWAAPAALQTPSLTQHSLIMTALNVQYGLEGGVGGMRPGASRSAGPSLKVQSRNSFLRTSRRHSVGDPQARKLRQAQSMVELISQHLSSTSVSFSAAQPSGRYGAFQQQQDWQQQQQEWQQQQYDPSAARTAADSPIGSPVGTAAMRAASQALLLPHQVASRQQQQERGDAGPQQQPHCAVDKSAVESVPSHGTRVGPFRTPWGLLQHLQQHQQQQQLSGWRAHESSSSSGCGAATLSTSYMASHTSGHATPMPSGSLTGSVNRSPVKRTCESIHCSEDGNFLSRAGGAAPAGVYRFQSPPPQQQRGGMHNSEPRTPCHHNSGVGRSGYISPCPYPEPRAMFSKAKVLAVQSGSPLQQAQSPSNSGPVSLRNQQHHQQQLSVSHGTCNIPGITVRAANPHPGQLYEVQPKLRRSNSMPASLEALNRAMQQAVVAVAAEAGYPATAEPVSRAALAVASCTALGDTLAKHGLCLANGKGLHGIGAFMPPLPENLGTGIRAVWGSEDAESAASSDQASAGGSLGVLSSTGGGSLGEPNHAGCSGWGQPVAQPDPEVLHKLQLDGQMLISLSANESPGCGLEPVSPGTGSQCDDGILSSPGRVVCSFRSRHADLARHADDVAIFIEQDGMMAAQVSQQRKAAGAPVTVSAGNWKTSLQGIMAAISGAVAQRAANTATSSITSHHLHEEQQQQVGKTASTLPAVTNSSQRDSPFLQPAVAAAAAPAAESLLSNSMTATAAQMASLLSPLQHKNQSGSLGVPTMIDPVAQRCTSHGSFSTMDWSATSRPNTPWSNVGSNDKLQSPGGSGPLLVASASEPSSAAARRADAWSTSWQQAATAADTGAAVGQVPAVSAAPAAADVDLPSRTTTDTPAVQTACTLSGQTPVAPLSCSPPAAKDGDPVHAPEAYLQAAVQEPEGNVEVQQPPASILAATAGAKLSSLPSRCQAAAASKGPAAIQGEATMLETVHAADHLASRNQMVKMKVDLHLAQPPRVGVTTCSELRRLGSVSFNNLPQLPVLPEAPASAELDSTGQSNEESTSSGSGSGSDCSSSHGSRKEHLQQAVPCSASMHLKGARKQQSPFMTFSFSASEKQHNPQSQQQQQPFTLHAAYQFATSGANRDELPPSPRSPRSPRTVWLRQQQQQQQAAHMQQLHRHPSDVTPPGMGSQSSGILRLQGSGHLGTHVSGRLAAQGSGRLAAQGSGHLGTQGSGRLVPQGSGRLAAQGSWGLRAQGSMQQHMSTQGQVVVYGAGQGGVADPLDSPRGLKLTVKIPETRRPSAQGQQLLHGSGSTAGPNLAHQGSIGCHHQLHLLPGAATHEDATYGFAVTTPESLASCPSHTSMMTDWNVGGLNSPLTARTNMLSVASGGRWGSMQLMGSSSYSGWSALSGASGHSGSSNFTRGMAPQVSVEVIEWRSLQLGRRIGRGAEGSVYEARLQDAPVAVKEGPGIQEIEMYLAAGVHDNIVGLRGLCHRDDGTWCLVLEWCRGTLDTVLHHSSSPLPRAKHPPRSSSNGGGSSSNSGGSTPKAAAAAAAKSAHITLSSSLHPVHTRPASGATGVVAAAAGWHSRPDLVKLLPLMRSIARGLLHLHSRRPAILHRDIKPANIFVGHGMVMKLGDFGMSRHVFPTPADTAASSRGSSCSASATARHGSSNGGGCPHSSSAGSRGSTPGCTNSSRLPDGAACAAGMTPAPAPAGLRRGSANAQQQQKQQQQQQKHGGSLLEAQSTGLDACAGAAGAPAVMQPLQFSHGQQHQQHLLPATGMAHSTFAEAVPVRTLTPGVVGTIMYSAPEVLDEQLQQPNPTVERILKADVYSFGVTMWEMLERCRPFEGLDGMQICAMWIADPQQMLLPPLTVADNAHDAERKVLAALQDLVRDCTAFNPDIRPTMKQVLERIRQAQRLCDPKTAAGAAGTVAVSGAVASTAAADSVPDSPAGGARTASSSSNSRQAPTMTPNAEDRGAPIASGVPSNSSPDPEAAGLVAVGSTRPGVTRAAGVTDPAIAAVIAAANAVNIVQGTATMA